MGIIGDGVDLLKLVDKGHNAALYKEIGGWIDKVVALQREKDDLIAQVKDLEEQIRFKGTLERVAGHTFVRGDDEEICPRCAEVDSRAVHLLPRVPQKNGMPRAACPQCGTHTEFARPAKRSQVQIS